MATHLKLPKTAGSFHPDTGWSVGFLWALGSMPESEPGPLQSPRQLVARTKEPFALKELPVPQTPGESGVGGGDPSWEITQ